MVSGHAASSVDVEQHPDTGRWRWVWASPGGELRSLHAYADAHQARQAGCDFAYAKLAQLRDGA